MVQIPESKVVQAKFNSQPREKAFQVATEKKVSSGQLGIHQRSISEAASEAIDLSTFKVKEGISAALSLLEEAKVTVDKLEPGPVVKTIHKHLHRATRVFNSTWDHTQVASLANAGVSFASMAMVDVGARAV